MSFNGGSQHRDSVLKFVVHKISVGPPAGQGVWKERAGNEGRSPWHSRNDEAPTEVGACDSFDLRATELLEEDVGAGRKVRLTVSSCVRINIKHGERWRRVARPGKENSFSHSYGYTNSPSMKNFPGGLTASRYQPVTTPVVRKPQNLRQHSLVASAREGQGLVVKT